MTALSVRTKCGLLALGFAFLVGLPSLFMKAELIDDGTILPQSAQLFREGRIQPAGEIGAGRFRPGYWVFQGVHGLLLGVNVFAWHVVRLGWSLVVVALLFWLLDQISGSPRRAALGAVLYSMSTGAMEIQYRLGPAELPLVLLQLTALCALARPGCIRLAVAAVAASFTIKEVAVVFIGVAAVGALLLRENRRSWLIVLGVAVVAFAAARGTAVALGSHTGSYSARYGAAEDVVRNTLNYAKFTLQNFNILLPLAAVAMAARRPWREDPGFRWAWIFLAYALGSIAINIPFWLCCRHYFVQACLGFSAFIALALPNPATVRSRWSPVTVFALAAMTVWDFAANANIAFQVHVRQSRFAAAMIQRIAREVPPAAVVDLPRPDNEGELEGWGQVKASVSERRPDLRWSEVGATCRIERSIFNPKLSAIPAETTGRALGRQDRPLLQYSLGFLVRPRVVSALEVERWSIQP
jgi:hypothetical protein